MKTPIILLSGQAGSGKDTVAAFLSKNYGASFIAQADPMKRLAKSLFGFTEEQLWGASEKRNAPDEAARERAEATFPRWDSIARPWLEDVLPGRAPPPAALWAWFAGQIRNPEPLTPRRVLQTLGTEWGRAFSRNMWVDYALRSARELLHGGKDLVVITDGRFRNEVLAVREAGGATVRIAGGGLDGAAAAHSSETEQRGIPTSWFDAILINNKAHGLDALEDAVNRLMWNLRREPFICETTR